MLELEDFVTVHALVQRGVYLCDIAAQVGVHPKTVGRALDRDGPAMPPQGRRGSLLDPFRSLVDQQLAEGVWNAVVTWRALQARGFAAPSPGGGTRKFPLTPISLFYNFGNMEATRLHLARLEAYEAHVEAFKALAHLARLQVFFPVRAGREVPAGEVQAARRCPEALRRGFLGR